MGARLLLSVGVGGVCAGGGWGLGSNSPLGGSDVGQALSVVTPGGLAFEQGFLCAKPLLVLVVGSSTLLLKVMTSGSLGESHSSLRKTPELKNAGLCSLV